MNLKEFLSDQDYVSKLYDKYSNVLPSIGTKCGCPFHGSTDSFNMYIDGSGIIRGHCFSDCSQSYNIIECISKFGKIDKRVIYDYINITYQVDLGNKTIMSVENELLTYQRNIDITKNKNYDYLINNRKLDQNTILRNKLILLNATQVREALNNDETKLNILVGTLKSSSSYLETNDDMLNYIFGSDSISKLIIDPDYNHCGISICFPFAEKKDRYRHVKTVDNIKSPLNGIALRNNKNKPALIITEGLFGYLVIDRYYNKRANTIALMGTSFKDMILNHIDKYNNLVLALDCDAPGVKRTEEILKLLDEYDYQGKVLIYYNSKYSAMDDFINKDDSFEISKMPNLICSQVFTMLIELDENNPITIDSFLKYSAININNYTDICKQLSTYRWFPEIIEIELESKLRNINRPNINTFITLISKELNNLTNYDNVYSSHMMFKKFKSIYIDTLYPSLDPNKLKVPFKEITRDNFLEVDKIFGSLLVEANLKVFLDYVIKNNIAYHEVDDLLCEITGSTKYIRYKKYIQLKYNKIQH